MTPTPAWRHVVAVLLFLAGVLPLVLMLFLHGAVALDTRYPEGVEQRLWMTTLALASVAWVLFAGGRSVQRGFRVGTWVTVGLVLAVLAGASAWTSATLMRAHTGHLEAGLVGDLHAFQVAQEAYRGAAGGRYADRIECVREPRACGVAAEAALGRAVADRLLRADPRYYRFRLDAPAPDRYALVAAPVDTVRSGTRAFCADSAGRLCTSDGAVPMQDGLCSPSPSCRDR